MSYKNKYLKYKNKYNYLKKQNGGFDLYLISKMKQLIISNNVNELRKVINETELEKIKEIINFKTPPDTRVLLSRDDNDHNNIFFMAIKNGFVDIVELLIDYVEDINFVEGNMTPLMCAYDAKKYDIINLLLQKKAILDDELKVEMLDNGSFELHKILLDNNIDIGDPNMLIKSYLYYNPYNIKELIEYLRKYPEFKLNLNLLDDAINYHVSIDIIKMLLTKGLMISEEKKCDFLRIYENEIDEETKSMLGWEKSKRSLWLTTCIALGMCKSKEPKCPEETKEPEGPEELLRTKK
jgi:hypothetical protein